MKNFLQFLLCLLLLLKKSFSKSCIRFPIFFYQISIVIVIIYFFISGYIINLYLLQFNIYYNSYLLLILYLTICPDNIILRSMKKFCFILYISEANCISDVYLTKLELTWKLELVI